MRSIAVVLILLVASALQAGEMFRWVTKDGVVSFTDTAKRIPSKYKDAAETITVDGFANFERLTIVATKSEAEDVQERLVRLRERRALAATANVTQTSKFTAPFRLTQEMRWLRNVSGYPGKRYVSVDVLYDSKGREIASALSSIGLGGAIYVDGQGRFPVK